MHMKVIVREGFVLHLRKQVEINGRPEIQESSFYEGQSIDLGEQDVVDNLHKLEPADKAATAFFTARFAPEAPTPVQGLTPEALQQMLAAAAAQGAAAAIAAMQTSGQAAPAAGQPSAG
jgi:hypothetical protein